MDWREPLFHKILLDCAVLTWLLWVGSPHTPQQQWQLPQHR